MVFLKTGCKLGEGGDSGDWGWNCLRVHGGVVVRLAILMPLVGLWRGDGGLLLLEVGNAVAVGRGHRWARVRSENV